MLVTRVFAALLTVAAAQITQTGQTAPAGWKLVTDTGHRCSVSIPPDWTVATSTVSSPDRTISASLAAIDAGSWDAVKSSLKRDHPPVKMVEDDGRALIYSVAPLGADRGKVGWDVAINSAPVCTASFVYTPGTDEEPLKKIAASLAAVK
jgi:hypothetical protein